MTPPTAIELDAYRAQTDRAAKLVDFVGRFAPGHGETATSGFDRGGLIDDDTPGAILEARDAAVQAAFEAIERLARLA
jgi:hypothetical protein